MRSKIVTALAIATSLQAGVAAANPLCSSVASGGIWEIDQVYVKMQARNYSSTSAKFELWLNPRVSGAKSACIDTANGWTKDGQKIVVVNNPLCNTANWGYASILLKNGDRQSDGTTWYVGRVPLTLDEYTASTGTHTQYKQNYDYNIVLNADKSVNKFCVDAVQGTLDGGSSAYWPAMTYPTEG